MKEFPSKCHALNSEQPEDLDPEREREREKEGERDECVTSSLNEPDF